MDPLRDPRENKSNYAPRIYSGGSKKGFEMKLINRLVTMALLFFGFHSFLNNLLLAGENQWSTNGPNGGNTKCITINPLNHNNIFIGTIAGGMFETTDAGLNWRHIESQVVEPTMRVIAMNPWHPDSIYAATAKGLFLSSDGGNSWNSIGPLYHESDEYWTVVINPHLTNIILISGPFIAYISTNCGLDWIEMTIPGERSFDDISVDPQNANIAYASAQSNEFGKGVYKSSDFGATWFNIQHNMDSTGYGTSISVDPVNSNIVYYIKADPFRTSGGKFVWKSIDAGENWLEISPEGTVEWSARHIRISPFDHNTIYLCSWTDGVFKSTDGGRSWVRKNNGLIDWTIRDMAIDPIDGSLYIGTVAEGVYKSIDEGESWQKISENINLMECHDLAFVPPENNQIIVGAGRQPYRANLADMSWGIWDVGISPYQIPVFLKIDKFNPTDYYLFTIDYFWDPYDGYPGFFFSTNSGSTWEQRNNGLPERPYFVGIKIAYPNQNDRLIFMASYGLYRTRDQGLSWSLCDNGIPSARAYWSIGVCPTNQNLVAVGDGNNNLYLSTNGGDSWNLTAANVPSRPYSFIYEILFHPTDENHIYVSGLFSGLFETTDGGHSWNNLTTMPVDSSFLQLTGITINPQNYSNMFIASNHCGVYQSHDAGHNWEPFNTGLDTTDGSGNLYFAPNDTNTLYFATGMRSVWSITRTTTGIPADVTPPRSFDLALSNYPNPFNSKTMINYSLPLPGSIKIEIYNISGQLVKKYDFADRPAGHGYIVWDATNDAGKDVGSGVYFARLTTNMNSISRNIVLMK